MLRFIEFKKNSFIVTFLYSMFTIFKRVLQTRLTCTRDVPTIKVKILGKVYFFKKRLLSSQYEIEILNARSLRLL